MFLAQTETTSHQGLRQSGFRTRKAENQKKRCYLWTSKPSAFGLLKTAGWSSPRKDIHAVFSVVCSHDDLRYGFRMLKKKARWTNRGAWALYSFSLLLYDTWIVSGSWDNAVRVWNMTTGELFFKADVSLGVTSAVASFFWHQVYQICVGIWWRINSNLVYRCQPRRKNLESTELPRTAYWRWWRFTIEAPFGPS